MQPQSITLTDGDIMRFWAKVNKDGPIPAHCPELGPCWLWTASRKPFGYGQISIGGKARNAHKVAWIIAHGEIADGKHVLHHCDNPPCCNPAHLRLGTQKDNSADMVERGRTATKHVPAGNTSRLWVPERHRGLGRPNARHHTHEIFLMRHLYHDTGMTLAAVGERFGISEGSVSRIVNGLRYTDVPMS